MNLLKIILNEIRKEVLIMWSYKLQWMGEFISLIMFYMFLANIIVNNSNSSSFASMLNYCIWFYSISIIGGVSTKITQESQAGTFEQMYLSIAPVVLILFAKIFSSIVRAALLMLLLLIPLVLTSFIIIDQGIILRFFITLILITPGLLGISLIIGGITLIYRDVSFLTNIFNNFLLIMGGAFLPVKNFPSWLRWISEMLPITHNIWLINSHNTFGVTIIKIALFNIFYFILGLSIFQLCEKKARLIGNFGKY
ncbi:MAG: ABC transporter permease [Candidatus Babeliales bacterium]|nr:ABC transporter permease [Candidatus Babeliales bacterium]